MAEPILKIEDLSVSLNSNRGQVHAVQNLNFSLNHNETMALLGESGCGKTVTALTIMDLLPKKMGHKITGKIFFLGQDILSMPTKKRYSLFGDRITMIFQEPMTSLNPVLTIGDQMMEIFCVRMKMNRTQAKTKCVDMLKRVQISSPNERFYQYPHELSGGMRQRVMIAMALSSKPDLLIADEPTTALDVTYAREIMELIDELKIEMGLSMLFITHDIRLAFQYCEQMAVMYAGQIVEMGLAKSVLKKPFHPYTFGLLKSLPDFGAKEKTRLYSIPGHVPNLMEIKPGCRFYERCFKGNEICLEHEIEMCSQKDRQYRCLFPLANVDEKNS